MLSWEPRVCSWGDGIFHMLPAAQASRLLFAGLIEDSPKGLVLGGFPVLIQGLGLLRSGP